MGPDSPSHAPAAPADPLRGQLIDVRASQIDDPIARLRYLRKTATPARKRSRIAWLPAAIGGAVLLILVTPIPSITSGIGLFRLPPAPLLDRAPARTAAALPKVWLVEQNKDFEVYSNGLRVEKAGAQTHTPRNYLPLARHNRQQWDTVLPEEGQGRTAPAGIVYHTTESHIVHFDPANNDRLRVLARGVLGYVRQIRAYHYLIDRFGRVYRVVEESSTANHAGHSIWADTRSVYVNLNESFLGIAFEAQTRPQDGIETISQAQQHSGRILTEMLRSKYLIPGENCVTHAQVSVNPHNRRIGAHTDWAVGFPFGSMGLPDNYALPVPSITVFGFEFDTHYVSQSEARLWKGLLLSQEELRQGAAQKHMTLSQYRISLNRQYQSLYPASRPNPLKEDSE